MLRKIIVLIIATVILASAFTVCDNGGGSGGGGGGSSGTNTGGSSGGGSGGGGQGYLTISFQGGASGSVRSTVSLNQLNYQITLTGNGETKSLTANGGDTVQATVSVGYWTVSVAAFYQGGLYATGSNYVDVKAGQSNSVSISLSLVGTSPGGGGGGTGGGTPPFPTYTVTFNSGGSPYETRTVAEGSALGANMPENPTTTGQYSKFNGWQISPGVLLDDTTPVTDDITVTALWEAYVIGDPGPGGGIIFYAPGSSFTIQAGGGITAYTAWYLEVAPANDSTRQWGFDGAVSGGATTFTADGDPGSSDIGNGRKDTALIVAAAAGGVGLRYPAAQTAVAYTSPNGTTGDWFLPSLGELKLLCDQKTRPEINITTGRYWSSSQYGNGQFMWSIDFSDNSVTAYNGEMSSAIVRPIRAVP